MFEKKSTYAQGEMRPLSALSKGSAAKPSVKKTVPVQTPASPEVQSTVSSLSGQNKITDTATVQRTPLLEEAQKSKPVPVKEDVQKPVSAPGPDLSTKAARDAYFSKYLSRTEAPRKPIARPVISHVKETPEAKETPVQQETVMQEEELTLEAPSAMTEAIENAAQAKRQEREARNLSQPQPSLEKAESVLALVRTILLLGILVLCGVFLLLGPHTKPESGVPQASVQTVLNGSYPSAVASYYNNVLGNMI